MKEYLPRRRGTGVSPVVWRLPPHHHPGRQSANREGGSAGGAGVGGRVRASCELSEALELEPDVSHGRDDLRVRLGQRTAAAHVSAQPAGPVDVPQEEGGAALPAVGRPAEPRASGTHPLAGARRPPSPRQTSQPVRRVHRPLQDLRGHLRSHSRLRPMRRRQQLLPHQGGAHQQGVALRRTP